MVRLKHEIAKKRPQMQRKKCFSIKTMSGHTAVAIIAKLHELKIESMSHPPYSLVLAPSFYYLFAKLKKMLSGKKIGPNGEEIAETEAYFEALDKSFYRKGIEILEKRWIDCITFEGDYLDK
ncbi:hypothetical protein O3G_MSEX001937 [Manduca sexta]|uniref:Histone-lysine N-methyltransferase SETMAR n=1 Tax=Manduca sexta TaxID=7130 RepID=A0A922CD50_MANSE|nr:hypothetical protein O3G_MSEX001937 [Manduca sexta]